MIKIESLSVRTVTIAIFLVLGMAAVVLSLLAGSYFRHAALNAQVGNLSRVIEVATHEVFKEIRKYSFDLGMKLGNTRELVEAFRDHDSPSGSARLTRLLNDPFINGFVGFASIDLHTIRLYDLDLEFISESTAGVSETGHHFTSLLKSEIIGRAVTERLKAIDALWVSPQGPLYSTLVPLGGLRPVGYMEIVANPAFNLPNIGNITGTPISVFDIRDELLSTHGRTVGGEDFVPVEYVINAYDGQPAFRIVGYENIERLNNEMLNAQMVTTGGFLAAILAALLFALWLFSRFLFLPLEQVMRYMRRVADGRLDLTLNKHGLREFATLAETFETMALQVRERTCELERLLDLDNSALVYVGANGEILQLNRGAKELLGYTDFAPGDLDSQDLFALELDRLMQDASDNGKLGADNSLLARLDCSRADGSIVNYEAVIKTLSMKHRTVGFAVVLQRTSPREGGQAARQLAHTIEQNAQRMQAIEHALSCILEKANGNPGLLPGFVDHQHDNGSESSTSDARHRIREQAVLTMRCALTCWEHDLGGSKLKLAEQSGIWPVYIDKSTPTMRTLDKYLSMDTCPKNPRYQRVIGTAEFVIRMMHGKTSPSLTELQAALELLQFMISGVKSQK